MTTLILLSLVETEKFKPFNSQIQTFSEATQRISVGPEGQNCLPEIARPFKEGSSTTFIKQNQGIMVNTKLEFFKYVWEQRVWSCSQFSWSTTLENDARRNSFIFFIVSITV